MFLSWFIKKVDSSSRVYCFFAQAINSSVLVQLPSRDITQWLNENIAIGCFSENTKHMNRPFSACINQHKNINNGSIMSASNLLAFLFLLTVFELTSQML
jgi:hypothetical protein